jgi:hypothetical protein
MKFLKNYNENIRNLMKPKTENEIMDSLLINNNIEEQINKCIKYNFFPYIENIINDENITLSDPIINKLITYLYHVDDKIFIKKMLTSKKILKNISNNDIYILEKYKLGLHQNEIKSYEDMLLSKIKNFEYKKTNDESRLLFFNNNVIYINYHIKPKIILYNYDLIKNLELNNSQFNIILKNIMKNIYNIDVNKILQGN